MSEQDQSIRGYIPVAALPESEQARALRQQKVYEAVVALIILLVATVMVFVGVLVMSGVGAALTASGTMVFIVGLLMGRNT